MASKLTWSDLEDLTEFLLRHMSQETRAKLMAERPVIYHRLYPDVSRDLLLSKVSKAMADDES